MFKKLFQNINFLKSSRWVWLKPNPEASVPSVSEEEEFTEFTLESLGELWATSQFVVKAQKACYEARGKGEAVVEGNICSLRKNEKYMKITQFRQFIDELGEKFLSQLPELKYRKTEDSYDRFQKLQDVMDMEAVMKRFNRANSYEIKPYIKGKQPLSIHFTYSDETMEDYPLELAHGEKTKALQKGFEAILEGISGRELTAKQEKIRKKEWKKMEKEMPKLNLKIYNGEGLTDEENEKAQRYQLELPHQLIESLKWNELSSDERVVAERLEELMKDHPLEYSEGKRVKILVTRRPKIDTDRLHQEATAEGWVELISPDTFDIIALFDMNGNMRLPQ